MSGATKISWCEATWNPVIGCSKTSPGCLNCYAERMAGRLAAMFSRGYSEVVTDGRWNGKTVFVESELEKPLHWKTPRIIFPFSMSDPFHESVPFEWIDRAYAVMALCPQHTFMLLTKRVERMAEYCSDLVRLSVAVEEEADAIHPLVKQVRWDDLPNERQRTLDLLNQFEKGLDSISELYRKPLPNVCHMTTVCNQNEADKNIPVLLQVPSAMRGVSIEPMLGAIAFVRRTPRTGPGSSQPAAPPTWDVKNYLTGWRGFIDHKGKGAGYSEKHLDYVVVGGESGPGARPLHPDWVRGVRDQCVAAGVKFHFKQWGEWAPLRWQHHEVAKGMFWMWQDGTLRDATQGMPTCMDGVALVKRVGKANAGHLLDGVEWRERIG